jgi:hypothetical protein
MGDGWVSATGLFHFSCHSSSSSDHITNEQPANRQPVLSVSSFDWFLLSDRYDYLK